LASAWTFNRTISWSMSTLSMRKLTTRIRSSARRSSATRLRLRKIALREMACPLTVASLPSGILAGLEGTGAGAGIFSAAMADRQANPQTIAAERRFGKTMDFLLVPRRWIKDGDQAKDRGSRPGIGKAEVRPKAGGLYRGLRIAPR